MRKLLLAILAMALVLGTTAQGAVVREASAASFCDVPADSPYYQSVTQLAARGIIHGYENGCFGLYDPTLRAQMAALIARAMGWDAEDHGNAFPDQGVVDPDLWRNVGTLAYYGVAKGYDDGTYNPTGYVLYEQVILFISRAMVAKGTWTLQADDPSVYPNLPDTTDKEKADHQDVVTYVHYAGALPGVPLGGPFGVWDQPSTRGWFAAALWQVLGGAPVVVPAPAPAPSPSPMPSPSLTPSPSPTPSPTPSPSPADNFALAASVSNPSPAKDSVVTVSAVLTNNGQGVAGATMQTSWHYKTVTSYCSGGPSGGTGRMACSRNIGFATSGYTVVIDVVVSYQGHTFTTSTRFTPP